MKVSRESVKTKPSIEKLHVVLIEQAVLDDVVEWVAGCESCDDNAVLPFDYLLDVVTDCDPTVTEYLMCRLETCPFCLSKITEKTRVSVRSRT